MEFKKWLLNEAKYKRSMRQRVSQAKKIPATGAWGTSIPYTQFKSKKEAMGEMMAAFKRAQEINKKWRGETPVYHMIHPDRLDRKDFNLDSALRFLTSKSPKEVSVSVEKGVWGTGLVIAGEGKITAYWPTDVYTRQLPSGMKIPQAHNRPSESHHWDEALIRYF